MSRAHSPREHLASLVAVATIGADRAGKMTPDSILSTAAAAGIRSRAGFRAGGNAAPIEPAAPDATPIAPAAALATLERLLADPDASLIEGWADLARARGMRVGDSLAPSLLDWWSRQPQRAESVFRVLGTRGEWLASLNPDWRKPVAGDSIPGDADTVWQTGTMPERTAVLLTVRRHDPTRALAMVQETWPHDGADERRRFLEALAENPSMADEPFLETTLDDRSKLVRRQGAALLGTIRGSRFRARMTERARTMISVDAGRKGLLRRAGCSISLAPPDKFDPSWERDGIEEQAPQGTGKRTWWMFQVLSLADLSLWTDLTGLDPEAILAALAKDDFYSDALDALGRAVNTIPDMAWNRAVLGALLNTKKPWGVFDVWSVLPLPDQESLVLEAAAHGRFSADERWTLLSTCTHAWSPHFSGAAVKLLDTLGISKRESTWALNEAIDGISRRIAIEAIEAFEHTITRAFPDGPPDRVKRSLDRLRLRSDIHKEFLA